MEKTAGALHEMLHPSILKRNSETYRSVLHDLFSLVGIVGDCIIQSRHLQLSINNQLDWMISEDTEAHEVLKNKPIPSLKNVLKKVPESDNANLMPGDKPLESSVALFEDTDASLDKLIDSGKYAEVVEPVKALPKKLKAKSKGRKEPVKFKLRTFPSNIRRPEPAPIDVEAFSGTESDS